MLDIRGRKWRVAIAATGCWKIEIVKRSDAKGFVVLPKRWIVERTLAWISRQPSPHARLRALCDHRRRFRPSRHDPPHAQTLDLYKSLFMNPVFVDRLSSQDGSRQSPRGLTVVVTCRFSYLENCLNSRRVQTRRGSLGECDNGRRKQRREFAPGIAATRWLCTCSCLFSLMRNRQSVPT